jgi:hypothetical protein
MTRLRILLCMKSLRILRALTLTHGMQYVFAVWTRFKAMRILSDLYSIYSIKISKIRSGMVISTLFAEN